VPARSASITPNRSKPGPAGAMASIREFERATAVTSLAASLRCKVFNEVEVAVGVAELQLMAGNRKGDPAALS
jgi:hypothetical protein